MHQKDIGGTKQKRQRPLKSSDCYSSLNFTKNTSSTPEVFFCTRAPGWIDPDGHQRTLFQVFTKLRGAAGHASAAVLAPFRTAFFRRFESNVKHEGASLPGARTKIAEAKA